ncbi:MAG: hypothetical protein M1822_005454 [Bathelium mastoideum]|nr:MAG: hypothetical protein M1822_005454 [Bathelium mastoideum]
MGMIKSFGVDDSLMLITLLFFTAYLICQLGGLMHGTGRHMADLEPREAKMALKFWWFCELFYILSSCFLKIAIGQFLLRIAVAKVHRWIIRLVMISTGVFGTFYFLLAVFQCHPPSQWWANLKPNSGPDCLSPSAMVSATYTAGALNTIADWTLGILPIFIVWNLSINRRVKVIVAGILGFAALGSTATIVRIPFTKGLAQTDDFLWTTSELAFLSTLEPGIGITAGCLATLKPLLQRILVSAGFSSTSRGSNMALGRRDHGPNKEGYNGYVRKKSGDYLDPLRPDLEDKTLGTITTITGRPQDDPLKGAGVSKSWRDRSQSSGDSLTESHDPVSGGIQKSVQVTTYEELELVESGGICAVRKV